MKIMTFNNEKGLYGIDISTFQKPNSIDWEIASKVLNFAILRAGFGRGNTDECFNSHYNNCFKYNIPVGLYWFSYAYNKTMAEYEADCVLRIVKQKKIEYPIYFDWEYDSRRFGESATKNTISNETVRRMAEAFCNKLEDNGYYAGIYCNADYRNNVYGESIFKEFDCWYARYGYSAESDKIALNAHMLQYTSAGSVQGFNHTVDCNISRIDFPKLLKQRGLNNL